MLNGKIVNGFLLRLGFSFSSLLQSCFLHLLLSSTPFHFLLFQNHKWHPSLLSHPCVTWTQSKCTQAEKFTCCTFELFFFSEILFEHLLLFQFLCVKILYILNGHVWATSRRWWRTGKSGILQSMGSQRVGQAWVTEQW